MKAAKEFTQTLLRYGHYGILFTRRRINVSHTRSQLRNGVLGNLPRAVATLGMAPSEHFACARGGGVTSEVDKYRAGGRTDGWSEGATLSLSLCFRGSLFPFPPSLRQRTADGQQTTSALTSYFLAGCDGSGLGGLGNARGERSANAVFERSVSF